MTVSEALEAILKSYKRYYNIKTEDVADPFCAEASFHSHGEQYFLLKKAVLSEADSHEYVFFATADELDVGDVEKLDERAWEEGMSRVKPHPSHRNTDVVLILIAEHISGEAKDYIRTIKRYQSYRHTLQGWSHYSVVAQELSTGELSYNKRGKDLVKLFRNRK